MKSTSSRWSRRTFAKRRRETSEGSEGLVTGQGDQELPEGGTQDDPEMTMENHETKETSSSRESGQRSAERRESSMQGGSSAKPMMNSKKNEKKPAGRRALMVATSCRFLKQAHQLPRMGSGEVDIGGSRQSTLLKHAQDDEPAQEDQPQARRLRL